MSKAQIIILDFGSQYTQLLARRIRELNVFVEVVDFQITMQELKDYSNLKGIILSGGPASVYESKAYRVDNNIYELGLPILGVCYGMQLIVHDFKGTVSRTLTQEFGASNVVIKNIDLLLADIPTQSIFWMSHADHVETMPNSFEILANSENSIAIIKHQKKPIYGVQFHAEVSQSQFGSKLLSNFIFKICGVQEDWALTNFIENEIKNIRNQVGDQKVILGLSGGVDSYVAAILLQKAIGDNLTCVFVDHGLLRKNEANQVIENYSKNFDLKIVKLDVAQSFYQALAGVEDPEEKRKIIGKLFIDTFNDYIKKSKDEINVLAQGTIYSDVIESSKKGHASKTIKSHHNVGGLPKDMNLKIIEPLKTLFKDEVRKIGEILGIDSILINRHPFPGPGLGIRVIGEVTREKCDILREVDAIFIEELRKNDLYDKVSQAFATILPVKTVGVMGDNRTYDYLVSLRSVNTIDFMTAESTHLPWDFLDHVTKRIINEVNKVNRVVYDITSKPPGTIEWE